MKLQKEQIIFETIVGREFDDKIYEMAETLKKAGKFHKLTEFSPPNSINNDSLSKNNKNNKNKNSTKKNNTKTKEKITLDDLDEAMKAQVIKELHKREKRRKSIIVLMSLIALGCFGYFGFDYYNGWNQQNNADSLSELVGDQRFLVDKNKEVKINLTDSTVVVPDVLEKYQTLYNKNKTMIGWLKIDDTLIDYPVMQTVDNSYYLDHNFDLETDKNGTLFVDTNCNILERSANIIIYGHRMLSGKMFGTLENYKDKSYYDEHPLITFDTIYEEASYKIMYVFRSKIFNEEDIVFKYYQFFDANSQEEFDSYMKDMSELSLYDTGVTASYGDELLTLSTCDYYEEDGRFVVVAKRVK
jgi:sortase B